jgi:hypothetical protein
MIEYIGIRTWLNPMEPKEDGIIEPLIRFD